MKGKGRNVNAKLDGGELISLALEVLPHVHVVVWEKVGQPPTLNVELPLGLSARLNIILVRQEGYELSLDSRMYTSCSDIDQAVQLLSRTIDSVVRDKSSTAW